VATKRQIVFVSCGQSSDGEKSLGQRVADLVTEMTPFKGYFAQNQNELAGVAEHILGAINRSVGFIAVMHHRGAVTGPHPDRIRASVWIEQEIAIAAFLRLIHRKHLPVLLYVQSGIALEGLREELMLHPVPFGGDDDVLSDLRSALPTWRLDVAEASLADTSLEGRIRASLIHCERINVTINLANDSDFEIIPKRIEIRGDSGLITEPYEWVGALPIGPRRPTNPLAWLAQTPPAATLAEWNSNVGLFSDADIEIVFECEILGVPRRFREKKKVKVSAHDQRLRQVGP